jgi:Domain of unknown function (DUF5664)
MDEIEVTPRGGKHTRVNERWDLLPYPALRDIAECMHHGSIKYGEKNYQKISVAANINHAIRHAFMFIEGDTSEDHLVNAATRMVFALELFRRGDPGAATAEAKK